MIDEGRLRLEVDWDGKQVTDTEIHSTRPLHACRVLEGRLASEAIATVPLLFSICGRSQMVAAAMALEAAAGRNAPAAVRRLRELVLTAECAHEHLWRLLLDLPALLGEPADPARFVEIRRRFDEVRGKLVSRTAWWQEPGDTSDMRAWRELGGDLRIFVEKDVLGREIKSFLDFEGGADWPEPVGRGVGPEQGAAGRLLERIWNGGLGRSNVMLMALPEINTLRDEIAPALSGDEGFAAAPLCGGVPRETGALAREAGQAPVAAALARHGNTVGVRLLARLTELARLAQRMRELSRGGAVLPWLRAVQLGAWAGIAAVETARGLLIHRVALDGETVARYRVVAPTEWNFHSAGAFAKGLVGHEARDEGAVKRAAALLAHTLDPCVACEIRVRHA